jgi:hypothetical protein
MFEIGSPDFRTEAKANVAAAYAALAPVLLFVVSKLLLSHHQEEVH